MENASATVKALLATPETLRRLALASIIANVIIVVTGGAVRLTGSGLGCPTWPQCTESSYVANAAMGIHGAIEFSNRLLTFVLILIAVLGFASALLQSPRRSRAVKLSVAVALGIPAQGVVGGLTVLTDLNPWVVACHFLVSMAVIAAAYAFWVEVRPPSHQPLVPSALRSLALVVTAASAAVLVAGTVVTGSGPHAGDEKAHRTGLSPEAVAQVHADLVFLLLGLAVASWFAARTAGSVFAARRAVWLIGIILAQGVIGFVQYFTHLPEVLVGAHMAGACAVWLGTLALLWATPVKTDSVQARRSNNPASLSAAGR